MKLKTVILENFRSYKNQFKIEIADLTALIGKNDVGKSTILEALEIFFNNSLVKIESNDACVFGDSSNVRIGCVFTDLPEKIVLDTLAETSLKEEFLVNSEGHLEIHKVFDCSLKSPKEAVFAVADHPTADMYTDLLLLKNNELKKRCKELGVDTNHVDMRNNSELRKAIWNACPALEMNRTEIPLSKENAKTIWEMLSKNLPSFALFQSDRPSKDEDSEVQDPMKIAVSEAIQSVEGELEKIKQLVKERVFEVATRTLTKLREMDATLASELSPNFKSDPKWEGLFKLSLTGDHQIPINKRGSGVRRLILLNFFRAEAERKQMESNAQGIIYAIEEPETAQHPSNQKLLIKSLIDLAEQDGCQVLLTTHVPGLAGLLPDYSLRYISNDQSENKQVFQGDDDIYKKIAMNLGVLPDNRIRVFVCVEGPNDIAFLKNISSLLHQHDNSIPDLEHDPRVSVFQLGGSTLNEWVQNHYLKETGRPEIHIYDRDDEIPKYQQSYDEVNRRDDGSCAFITQKKELENYLHTDAIYEVFGVHVEFGPMDDVPLLIAKEYYEKESGRQWADLKPEKKKKNVARVKKRLNDEVVRRMTIERLLESDPDNEISGWLRVIAAKLSDATITTTASEQSISKF